MVDGWMDGSSGGGWGLNLDGGEMRKNRGVIGKPNTPFGGNIYYHFQHFTIKHVSK